ncbi:DUF29 domain-containing protein [Candidatus Competibacter phosphatis]|nr:DUF29 domain-containing protein [Candidatus Competibacter phosphatis]
MSDLHRQDFHAWTRQQADLIRSDRLSIYPGAGHD